MSYPPLLKFASIDEYRGFFERTYCTGSIATFDGIKVRFRKTDFDHCSFESSRRNHIKDQFSPQRAERLGWIKAALQDVSGERYVGWDKARKKHDSNRRVTIVQGNYVVVIAVYGKDLARARFITAYVADTPQSLQKIRRGPVWAQKNR